MREAWIIDAARTPRGIGKPGQGALSSVHAQRILSTVLRALQARNGLNTDDIDEVIMGCFAKSGEADGWMAAQNCQEVGAWNGWGPENRRGANSAGDWEDRTRRTVVGPCPAHPLDGAPRAPGAQRPEHRRYR